VSIGIEAEFCVNGCHDFKAFAMGKQEVAIPVIYMLWL